MIARRFHIPFIMKYIHNIQMKAKTDSRGLTMVKLYDVDYAAKKLKLPVISVYNLVERGELTCIKTRTLIWFTENHINAYMKKRERYRNYGKQ